MKSTRGPYAETGQEEIVTAGVDTQADGTKVSFYTYRDGFPDIEITEAGLAAIASEDVFETPLTDAAIVDLAADYSNHTLPAESGKKFAVIEYQDLIEFVREVEDAAVMSADKQIRESGKARIDINLGGKTTTLVSYEEAADQLMRSLDQIATGQ